MFKTARKRSPKFRAHLFLASSGQDLWQEEKPLCHLKKMFPYVSVCTVYLAADIPGSTTCLVLLLSESRAYATILREVIDSLVKYNRNCRYLFVLMQLYGRKIVKAEAVCPIPPGSPR